MSHIAVPELVGVVLAGGRSRRMRRDKGTVDYHGVPQAEHCCRLLADRCTRVFVSVNRQQCTRSPYTILPLLEDPDSVSGPAAGLQAAWVANPDAALLVLAVDLPLVDSSLLSLLVERRNPSCQATAWVHPDGVPEPLCTIWEPSMCPDLIRATRGGSTSLRRLLETADVELLEPPEPEKIASVNTEEAYRDILRALGRN